MSYTNVNNFIVIADDNRDPFQSWRNHRSRTPASLGGVDCVAQTVGTPLYAPDDCSVSFDEDRGSAGNVIVMNMGAYTDEFMHASRGFDKSGVKKGELVGWSGNSGGVAPHVHWHRLGPWYNDQWGSTNRYNPWNFFGSTAGGGNEEINMPLDASDKDWLNKFGVAVIQQILGTGGQGDLQKGANLRDRTAEIKKAIADQTKTLTTAIKAVAPTITDAQIAQIVAKVNAGVKAPTAAENATATRAEFAKNPLK